MKNLTKKQRHSIYKKALVLYKTKEKGEYKEHYLCWVLGAAIGDRRIVNLEQFPEILAQKPNKTYENSSTVWWSTTNRKSRERVLEQAIKETSPNGKNK